MSEISEPLRQRMLIIDDEPEVLCGLALLLSDAWDVRTAASGREGITQFSAFSPDVVLLDILLPDFSGIDLLQQFKMYSETVAVIMMSGAGTLERIVESMKLGAETFLQKPFDDQTLRAALQQVTTMLAAQRELLARRRTDSRNAAHFPGVSDAIEGLNASLDDIARSASAVLIEGESGAGKGVLARMIHDRSPRSRAPFVDLNCAGLSKELLESELFGHERGAFTGATNTKPGLFEIANDGTLFLDEISEMETTVQARLLKAIEEKRFRRVGGVRDLRSDFRLIVATNRDLAAEVSAGRFRTDLYYRINVVRLKVPPLRERLEDLPVLIPEILRPLAKELGRTAPAVSARALQKLMRYPWPGNVRELRNVLERALLMQPGNEIRTEHVFLDPRPEVAGANSVGQLPREEWEIQPLDTVIALYVEAAVKAADGNARKAARQLQISPSTLYARLKTVPQKTS
ncbi:MAG: sigma-54-dependent transcriptional regulator [Thermoanaerobaculia bacterium]